MQWLPNALTASRLFILVPLMWLLATAGSTLSHQLAFGLFLLASLTDALDGWAARRFDCVINLGIFLPAGGQGVCHCSSYVPYVPISQPPLPAMESNLV